MRPLEFEDYRQIWERRKWWFLTVAYLVATGTAAVTALIPRQYTSECLILLEGQEVSSNYVKPLSDADVQQQLSTLIQQSLSRTRMERIMRDLGILVKPADQVTESLTDEFRSQIAIQIIKDTDPRRATNPYALKISFSAARPQLAQMGANELASFFVSEKLKNEERTAQETVQFLQSQADTAAKNLDEKQQQLADFKKRYSGQLPIDEQLNIQSLVRLQTQLQVNQQALERARAEVATIESLSQQNADATPQLAEANPASKLNAHLDTLKAHLADLVSRDTPNHPDVVKTRSEIAQVEAEMAKQQPGVASAKTTIGTAKLSPSNVTRQRDDLAEIAARQAEQKRIELQISDFQKNLQSIPLRAQQYSELQRAYEDSKAAFDTVRNKLHDTQIASDVQTRLQGQRFRIQDFASLPDAPSWPVPWKINLGGLGAALLLGVVLAGGLELSDTTLKTERDVEYYLKLKNLATILAFQMAAKQPLAWWRNRGLPLLRVAVVVVMSGVLSYLYLIRK